MLNEEYLRDFLEEHNLLDQFIESLKANTSDYYMGVDGADHIDEAISMAFDWQIFDIDDEDIWDSVHMEWIDFSFDHDLDGDIDMKVFMELVEPKVLTNEEILKMFLKKKRKLTSFKKSLTAVRDKSLIHNAISGAFTWMGTPEGHDYWQELNNEWVGMCKNLNITGEIKYKDL